MSYKNKNIPEMRLLLSMGDSRIFGGLGDVTWLMRDGRWIKLPSDSVMLDSCGVTDRLLDSTRTTSGLGDCNEVKQRRLAMQEEN